MVLETKSSLEAGVIGAGHSYAGSRLDAQRSVAGWASEQMGGIAYLDYVRQVGSLHVWRYFVVDSREGGRCMGGIQVDGLAINSLGLVSRAGFGTLTCVA